MAQVDSGSMADIFGQARQLAGQARDAFLEEACGDDEDLRREVEQLLAEARPDGVLGAAWTAGGQSTAGYTPGGVYSGGSDRMADYSDIDLHAGCHVGPYCILEAIGEGGLGSVYLAEQRDPVRRLVALKVIKLGMDTRDVVTRFEAERQALAVMDHSAIAKVYDAGATAGGRPYFAMEYVPGIPITRYCDQHQLSIRERLHLFLQVCAAVQHAHQKAVIHRDLKPANVLVSVQDDRPVPKLIDFGIAKAIGHRLTDKTMKTRLGMFIGTPEYMSPEQADPSALDVDTRTDVYALGVTLYELLVGAPPFDPGVFRQGDIGAIIHRIQDEEAPRPSDRFSTLGDQATQSAKHRRTARPVLQRELAGDLDWIVLRALEKDRTRRYGSVNELAADIDRYLNNEPVLATPPSAVYRVGKFVKRNTGSVLTGLAAVLVLIAFAVTMTIQAGRIAAERDRANAEAARANTEAEAKGQVSEFLTDLFTVSDPGEARGNSITAREILDTGVEKIDKLLDEQPKIAAEMMYTMGGVYRSLGLYGEAESLLERALAERRRLLGEEHPDTLDSVNSLARLYTNQGRYKEAEPLFVDNFAARKRLLGPDHLSTLDSMNNLAVLYQQQGRFDEAEPLYTENLAALKRLLGDDDPSTLESMNNLVVLYFSQDRLEEATRLALDIFAAQKRVLGEDHPSTVNSMNTLAHLYMRQGQYERAEPVFADTLASRKRLLGDAHPLTLKTMTGLALLYTDVGRRDEAETLLIKALAAQRRVVGDKHPDTAITLYNLAAFEADGGDRATALDWLRHSVEAGFAFPDVILEDNDLVSLHGTEFDALVARARENLAEQRAQ